MTEEEKEEEHHYDKVFQYKDGTPKYPHIHVYLKERVRETDIRHKPENDSCPQRNHMADYYVNNEEEMKRLHNIYSLYNKEHYNEPNIINWVFDDKGINQTNYELVDKWDSYVDRARKRRETKIIEDMKEKKKKERDEIKKKQEENRKKEEDIIFENQREDRIKYAIKNRKLRLEDIRTKDEIIEYLEYHIKYQDYAIHQIASVLWSIKNYTINTNNNNNNNSSINTPRNIFTYLSSGTSSIGKNELIQIIRPLFHMEEHGKRDKCYIRIQFNNIWNESHINYFTGSGSGYEGKDDISLVDELKNAMDSMTIKKYRSLDDIENDFNNRSITIPYVLKFNTPESLIEYIQPKIITLLHEKDKAVYDFKSNQQIKRTYDDSNTIKNVIILFIDELCKSGVDGVMNSLNSLLSDGLIKRSNNHATFQLRQDVILFVYITSNFGSEKILNELKEDNYNKQITIEDAKDIIYDDMKISGIQSCNISRISEILPFLPILKDDAKTIVYDYIISFFSSSSIVDEQYIQSFVNYFFIGDKVYRIELGIRPILKLLNSLLDELKRDIDEYTQKTKMNNNSKLEFHIISSQDEKSLNIFKKRYNDYIENVISNRKRLNDCLNLHHDLPYFKVNQFIHIVESKEGDMNKHNIIYHKEIDDEEEYYNNNNNNNKNNTRKEQQKKKNKPTLTISSSSSQSKPKKTIKENGKKKKKERKNNKRKLDDNNDDNQQKEHVLIVDDIDTTPKKRRRKEENETKEEKQRDLKVDNKKKKRKGNKDETTLLYHKGIKDLWSKPSNNVDAFISTKQLCDNLSEWFNNNNHNIDKIQKRILKNVLFDMKIMEKRKNNVRGYSLLSKL